MVDKMEMKIMKIKMTEEVMGDGHTGYFIDVVEDGNTILKLASFTKKDQAIQYYKDISSVFDMQFPSSDLKIAR